MKGHWPTTTHRRRVVFAAIGLVISFLASAALAYPVPSGLRPTDGSAKKTNENNNHVKRVAVFGDDNRGTLPRELRRLRKSIGLVYNNRARSVCTGFCVADQTIATAAHCLFRTAGERRPKLAQFRFVLRAQPRWPSSRIAGSSIRSPDQFVIAGSRKLKVEPPIDATRDWALMRLARPVCRGAVLPVLKQTDEELANAARRDTLLQVSFHHDYANWRLAHAAPCSLEAVSKYNRNKRIDRDFTAPGDLILHRCDTGGASSGSPLLLKGKNGELSVVAINVGTYVQTRMLVENGKVVRRFKSDAVANTAVSARAFADLVEPFTKAELLTAANDIRQLQTLLNGRGLYDVKIDGSFGPATRRAIQAFQGNIGNELAGLPTQRVLDELKSLAARPQPSNPKTRREGSQHLTRGQLNEKIEKPQ